METPEQPKLSPPPPDPAAPQPTCLTCGYVLKGLPGPLCPECGRPFSLKSPTTYRAATPPPPNPLRGPVNRLGFMMLIGGILGLAISVVSWKAITLAAAAGVPSIGQPFALFCPAFAVALVAVGVVMLYFARRR